MRDNLMYYLPRLVARALARGSVRPLRGYGRLRDGFLITRGKACLWYLGDGPRPRLVTMQLLERI